MIENNAPLLGGCFDRALAVMRLALGYGSRFPKGWDPTRMRTSAEVVPLLGRCFPDRLVLTYVRDPAMYAGDHRFDGVLFSDASIMGLLDPAQWLFAFAYGGNGVVNRRGNPDYHFVVGCPVDLKGHLQVPFVVAVLLDEPEAERGQRAK